MERKVTINGIEIPLTEECSVCQGSGDICSACTGDCYEGTNRLCEWAGDGGHECEDCNGEGVVNKYYTTQEWEALGLELFPDTPVWKLEVVDYNHEPYDKIWVSSRNVWKERVSVVIDLSLFGQECPPRYWRFHPTNIRKEVDRETVERESLERIVKDNDPRVPKLPFGFQNEAWNKLKMVEGKMFHFKVVTEHSTCEGYSVGDQAMILSVGSKENG